MKNVDIANLASDRSFELGIIDVSAANAARLLHGKEVDIDRAIANKAKACNFSLTL